VADRIDPDRSGSILVADALVWWLTDPPLVTMDRAMHELADKGLVRVDW